MPTATEKGKPSNHWHKTPPASAPGTDSSISPASAKSRKAAYRISRISSSATGAIHRIIHRVRAACSN